MEIADVFAINKADRKGVDQTRRDLEQMLDLSELPADSWRPPIVATVATTGAGTGELWDAINAHRDYAETSGQLESRRSFRAREELREIVANRLRQRAREICTGDRWQALTEAVAAHESDPWTAADTMLDGVLDA
jgi:LAO/AO transport system kinase